MAPIQNTGLINAKTYLIWYVHKISEKLTYLTP